MLDRILTFYENNKKVIRIGCAYVLGVIVLTIIVIIAKSGPTREILSNTPSGGNDSTALSEHRDHGESEQEGLSILNYTSLKQCMFNDERNYVIYAINKALLVGRSTHNNRVIGGDNNINIKDDSTNAEVYPVISGGRYFEAYIDEKSIRRLDEEGCQFSLSVKDGKKVNVRMERSANKPAKYLMIDVTFIN